MKRKRGYYLIVGVTVLLMAIALQKKVVTAASGYSFGVNGLNVYFDYPTIQKEVQVFDYRGVKIRTSVFTTSHFFSLPKNSIYYFTAYAINPNTGQKVQLVSKRAFSTSQVLKIKFKKKGKKFKFKTYKGKGIKSYTIYVSKKYNKGYKKVKTVKAGKSFTLSKFKKKKFKKNKLYYFKVVINKNSKIENLYSDNNVNHYFGYTVRYRFR